MPVLASVDQFLEVLKKSNLLEAKRLDQEVAALEHEAAMPPKPSQLAALFVRRGLLTNFQATQLVNGRWHGFFVSGKYKLLEPLGVGGMGKVFLAEHTLLKRLVAVKILPTEKLTDPSLVERFYREARAIAALDHPNIVRCYDVDKDQKLNYLVMEYVDGISLQQLVAQTGPLDPVRAAHYVSQTAAGLQHAHEAGWVHRDIKPGNLLVDRQGVVKILDLGLALILNDTRDQLTKQFDEKAVLGTADYLSPEQAMNSHEVDIRADLYSLGATFYYLLCGRPPFADGTVTQKLLWHQVKDPEHIRQIRPEVSVPMATVLHRLMSKDRNQRYQSPDEVMDALAPWTDAPIAPPAEAELPPRSAMVQSLQPISNPGTLSNGGAPTSDVRRHKQSGAPSSRVRQQGLASTPRSKTDLESPPDSKPTPKPNWLGKYGLLGGAVAGVLLVAVGVTIWALPSRESTPVGATGKAVQPEPPSPVTPPKPTTTPVAATVAPEDARNHAGKEVTIRMQVRLVGSDAERYFLNSEKEFRSETNFTVVIDRSQGEQFGISGVEALRKQYQDRTIHVAGPVTLFGKQKRPQIHVKDPGQLKLVEGAP